MRITPLVCTMACLAASCAEAPAQTKLLHGTVEKIDAKVGTIRIRRGLEPKEKPLTLNLLSPDLPVTNALGQALKLTDLRSTDRVLLTLANEDDVASIRQESDVLWGLVTKYDAASRSLVCKITGVERSFRLAPEVRLLADGNPAGPEVLTPGRPVNVVYSPDHTRVVEVRVGGRNITQYHPYGRVRYHPGLLIEADHARKRLKVVVMEDRYQLLEFEYEAWTSLHLAHGDTRIRDGQMSELRPYCKVTIYQETDTGRLFHVRGDPPTLGRRKVKSVDHAARKLTLVGEDDTAELTVAGDVLIRGVVGSPRWEDVRVGTLVTCTLDFEGREVTYLLVLPR